MLGVSLYTGKLLIYLGDKTVYSEPDYEISGKVLYGKFAYKLD